MSKCKDIFNKKFRLLCSQESHEEIHWSSSDSSEYENNSICDKQTNITYQQKRKRKRKNKVLKNISNLNVTIIDVAIDKDVSRIEKKEETSPILSSQYHPTYTRKTQQSSPILCPKTVNSQKIREQLSRSPILLLKTHPNSPTYNTKVKKKLFANVDNVEKICSRSKSFAPSHVDRQKNMDMNLIRSHSLHNNSHRKESKEVEITDLEFKKNCCKNNDQFETIINKKNKEAIKLDDSLESLKSSKDLNLVDKVKSYFDSHFSSDNASQVTIQDSLTPKNSKNSSKTSDDIEIISTMTQFQANKNSTEAIKEELVIESEKSKKIRYKKDGLAFRLNSLLKKHNAHISLWQHERFLAANSNFVIPKGEHLVFIIRHVEIKYGCFLLQARNIVDERFLILINNQYVNNSNISKDVILKVYEPYKILEFNEDFKLIINVCKFESEKLKDL